jgi:hypothetical protein
MPSPPIPKNGLVDASGWHDDIEQCLAGLGANIERLKEKVASTNATLRRVRRASIQSTFGLRTFSAFAVPLGMLTAHSGHSQGTSDGVCHRPYGNALGLLVRLEKHKQEWGRGMMGYHGGLFERALDVTK